MAKHKGKAKSAELSKKERKALKAREAELLAKLKRKTKSKTLTAADANAAVVKHDRAALEAVKPSAKSKTLNAAEQVLATPGSDEAHAAAKTAKAAAAEAGDDESIDDIKGRVKAKRDRRALLGSAEYMAGVDRGDEDAVTAYNAEAMTLGLSHYLTSAAETDRALEGKVAAAQAEAPAMVKKAAKSKANAPALEGPVDRVAEADLDAALEPSPRVKAVKAAAAAKGAKLTADEAIDAIVTAQAAIEVETDHGREFAVGSSVNTEEFAKPSEAPPQLEEGRNGYKIIQLGADGKPDLKRDGTPRTVRQLTRVTTYIANLEDTTNLEKWKMRTLLEGAALNESGEHLGERNDLAIFTVRDLMHVRDTAIAKAAKADRKGKLEVGERGRIEADATKAFKDAVNAIADELLELGGVHEKANRGTNLHALTELADAGKPLPDDESVTVTDRASVAAYSSALEVAGIRVLDAEVVIVDDVAGRAGRLDRIVLYRPAGAQRAKKVVTDIKTGRIDYGLTKIEQQVAAYADGKRYDLNTGERTPLGVDRHLGLLIHVPQGEGTAFIYELDLDRGRRGNKLSAAVREWRSESGKVSRAERAPIASA